MMRRRRKAGNAGNAGNAVLRLPRIRGWEAVVFDMDHFFGMLLA